jgi:hypothetical protein
VTTFFAIPIGMGAATYLEPCAPNNWISRIIQINIAVQSRIAARPVPLRELGQWVSSQVALNSVAIIVRNRYQRKVQW